MAGVGQHISTRSSVSERLKYTPIDSQICGSTQLNEYIMENNVL